MAFAWAGMTISYEDLPSYEDAAGVYFLNTPEGLIPVELTHEEWLNVNAIYAARDPAEGLSDTEHVFELVLKRGDKELDAKFL